MMEKDFFNAYILSNGCLKEFPDNKLSSFAVQFPSPLDISHPEDKKGVYV